MPRLRLDSLTSLRWVAALAVFAWHVRPELAGTPLEYAAIPGPLGVAFFFVLSGFVLAWSHRPGEPAIEFWRHRFARVVPSYLTVLGAAVLLLSVLHDGRPRLRDLALHGLMVQAWWPEQSTYFGLNVVGWSLSCEVFFYLMFPLLLPWLQSRRGVPVSAAIIVAVAVVDVAATSSWLQAPHVQMTTADYVVYVLPITRLAEFALGAALGAALREQRLPVVPVVPAAIAVVLSFTAVAILEVPLTVSALVAVPMAALIVGVAQRDAIGAPTHLRGRPLVVLGEWSYAFYLVHTVVLRAVRREGLPAPVGIVVGLGASVLLAAALHRVVERPLERRLRGDSRRLSAVTPSAGAS